MSDNSVAVVVLASRNKGKVRELAALLAPFGVDLKGLDAFPEVGEIEETGSTFEENAVLKARAVAELTGHVSIADDSGLEVDALDGAPGVYSARYSASLAAPASDEGNNAKLLDALRDVSASARTGRFRCAMAAAAPDGRYVVADGAWEGVILDEARGTNGFGYDPLFYDPALGMTAAELSMEEKNARSHRAKATRNLMRLWPAFRQECASEAG